MNKNKIKNVKRDFYWKTNFKQTSSKLKLNYKKQLFKKNKLKK